MARTPNLSMQTVKTIYALKLSPLWEKLPMILREHVGTLFDTYIANNGRIVGFGVAAPTRTITPARAAGKGGPRARSNRPRITRNGALARRTRGTVGPVANA